MKFIYPQFLWALPLVWMFFWGMHRWAERRRQKSLAEFAGNSSSSWLKAWSASPSARWETWLILLTLSALLIAMSRPMLLKKDDRSELQGVPYLVALDASRSMLATDVRPTRYGAATNALDRLFSENRADRIGIITFSGIAYLNAPLSFDLSSLRLILRYIQPEDYIDPGSSMTAAIDRAGRYFVSNNIPQRILILISDGEDLDGRPVEVARRWYRETGLKICTIGVGTSSGAKVPVNRSGTASATNTFGQQVTSRLNENLLQRIAAAAGGRYFRLGEQGEGLRIMREEFLRPLAEAASKQDLKNYRDLYQWPTGLALLLLLTRVWLASGIRARQPVLPSIVPRQL